MSRHRLSRSPRDKDGDYRESVAEARRFVTERIDA
jgi:hypothetical protein